MNDDSLWHWYSNAVCSCGEENFKQKTSSASWSDLQYVFLLLHSFRPDLITLTEFLDEETSALNFQKIQRAAECQFGIPRLLDKSETDLVGDKIVDDLPYFTYIAFLFANLEKIKPSCTIKNSDDSKSLLKEKPALKISSQHFLWCPVCQSDIRLFERFFVDDNVRHRKCFVCERCKKRLHVGLYRTTKDGEAYECLEHEKEDLLKKLSESELKTVPVVVDETSENRSADVFAEKEPVADKTNEDVSSIEKSPRNDTEIVLSAEISSHSLNDERQKTEPLLYPQLNSSNETQLEIMGSAELAVVKPLAPPRKKKPDASPSQPANQSPLGKPVPPLRTKLQPKDANCEYPDEKNPFDDDVVLRSASSIRLPSASTNPFGSDDDDSVSTLSSDNPFNDSDYDSEITDATRRKSVMVHGASHSGKREDMTKSYTAGVTSLGVPEELRMKSRSPSSTSSKKRPAPPPPSQPKSAYIIKKLPTPARKKRPAPPRPLPFRRQIRSEISMKPEEILINLNSTDDEIVSLEERGRLLEDEIRHAVSLEEEISMKPLIQKWLDLVLCRMQLVHRENEFSFLWRERQLDELHAEIEFQLRCIIEKPESEKREEDSQKETYLLQKLLNVIDEKSRLAESNIAENTSLKQRPVDDIDVPVDEASKGANSNEKEAKKKKHLKLRLKKLKKKLVLGK